MSTVQGRSGQPGFLLACLASICLCCASFAQAQQRAPRTFELRAASPQFWKLLDRKAELSTVADGFKFTEGPIWDRHGFLYVSDEQGNKIYRIFPDRQPEARKELLLEIGD